MKLRLSLSVKMSLRTSEVSFKRDSTVLHIAVLPTTVH